jgi:uncharacterized protein (DUF2267 family)
MFYRRVMERQISPGEAHDVAAQLPKDLREVWEVASARRAGTQRREEA